MELSGSYSQVQAKVRAAAGTRPITVIAVSKTQPIEKIQALYSCGQRDFGENYAQELTEKASALQATCPDIRWHFIGHLQSNKVKAIIPWVSSVHSVHSDSLAEELEKRWQVAGHKGRLPIFLEVNVDGEATKSGWRVAEVAGAAERASRLGSLKLEGLMCIPNPEGSDRAFRELRELEAKCRPFTQGGLSMGMSSDFESAIREGATHIRVGTLLFGRRL